MSGLFSCVAMNTEWQAFEPGRADLWGEVMGRSLAKVWSIVALLLVAVLSGGAVAGAGAQESTPGAEGREGNLQGAVDWLVAQQGRDGAYVGFSGESDPGVTLDAIIALAAAEKTGIDTGTAIEEAVNYLASEDVALAYAQTGTGQAAKLVLALVAAGEDPADFADVQPLTLIESGQNEETGIYGTGIFDHGLAMLALAATGSEVPETAINALTETQAPNGGWSFDGVPDDAEADSNTTALVVQALVASGNGESNLVASGLDYLDTTVTEQGAAFNAGPDSVPDSNSTALVVQAYLAAERDASDLTEALAAFQNDNGAFFYNAADTTDNLFSTVQAIPAQAGVALPVSAPPTPLNATPVGVSDLLAT